ncbi:hypothetical protein BGW41_001376 [Actinomortierella wolfii]|nr:hypothetical protein BGW41_001376 [Actinomortierella wolfii]
MLLAKTLIIIATATVVLAQDAIVSRGLFSGKDTTLPGARGLEVYEDPRNHATAAASILKYYAAISEYDPQSLPPAKAREAYKTFTKQARGFPGFSHSVPYTATIKLEGGFPDLQNKIEERYPFDDKVSVARELRYAFPVISKQYKLRQWEASLLLIRKPRPENEEDTNTPVTVELISLRLELATHVNGNIELLPQTTVLVVERFGLDSEYLKKYAQILFGNTGVTTIKQFEKYFTSPYSVFFPNLRKWYQSGDQDIF